MWIPSTGNAPIIVFAALFGFGSGAFVSLLPSCMAEISEVRQIGVRQGTVFAIVSIAALIGNPIGGSIITRWHGDFKGVQIYGGVMCTAGAVIILLARIRVGGLKIFKKV
jgi:MFS family permease